MKILHVMPYPGVGGTEIATRRIADAVRPFGVQSDALLLRPTEDQVAYLQDAGIACIADVPRPEPSLVREAPRYLQASKALARLCARYDVVHCADTSAAYHVALAGKLARRPVLCHVRNREKLPLRSRVFVAAADHFAFVSQGTLKQFPMPIAKRRRTILYDGVDVPRSITRGERDAIARGVRADFNLPDHAPVAAMFARVNPQKDYDTLISAAARLQRRHPGLRFLIVGDNALIHENRVHFRRVEAAARAAGVLGMFVFAGFREDTARLMQAADICVLCTHFEGLPLALIEAMAAGRPCIATAVDGVPEALTDGVTGLLHDHGDAEGLARALARLLDNPGLAERLAGNARAEALRRFSQPRFARDLVALYDGLTGRLDANAKHRPRALADA